MKVIETALPGVLILEPKVFEDERGFFFESWNAQVFREATGFEGEFVQDNHSLSRRRVLRGIHYQIAPAQGKLVRVVRGEVLDVAVDLRRSSPCFGRWTSMRLNADHRLQVWIPPGFGHGFLVSSSYAEVLYKATAYWAPSAERSLAWNDPTLGIDWGLGTAQPVLSAKDAAGAFLPAAEVFA